MNPQTIGGEMPHGFAGSYARQPDMIVSTRLAGGAEPIPFGAALKYDADGAVVPMDTGDKAEDFAGIAARELKSALSYLDQGMGGYAPGEAVSVFQRGSINVRCQNGTPKLGGTVYVRLSTDENIPAALAGGFEAASSDGAAALDNCQWAGPADSSGIAELRILTMRNA